MAKNNQSLLKRIYGGRKLILQIIKYKLNLTPKRFPLKIEFNPTHRCNLNCKHCYVTSKSESTKDPSLDRVKKLIDEVYNHGCRWFRLMGGESLLRDDIGEIINYAKKKGMFVEIATNGLLIEKRIKELKNAHAIVISLDGNKETNDNLRGKDSYEKIIAGLECAIKNGLRVRLHTVLTPITISSLKDMVELSKRYKVNINFGEAAGGKNWKTELGNINENDLISYYEQYKLYKKKGFRISNSYKAINYIMNWPWKNKRTIYKGDKKIKNSDFKIISCVMGRLSAFIDADGGVYACPKLWNQGISCFEHGFDKAWEHLENNLKCISCREIGCVDISLVSKGNIFSLIKSAFHWA